MRIQPKDPGSYPWYLKPFFWSQKRRYGEVLLPGLLWGRVPRLFMTVAMLYGALDARRSLLDPVLRSLLTVRVSQLNWCSFCVDINSATLARRTGSMAKVEALAEWRTSTLYSAPERAALAYTEAMTVTGQGVSDALMTELREYYSDDALIELTALVAFQNLSSKFNSALDVPPQGFCKLPAANPDRPDDDAS
jgi:AhpD family alkylhydroperoxidase